MVLRILKGVGWLVIAFLVLIGVVLAEAHFEIRRVTPPLPDAAALQERVREAVGPIRLSYINTASQPGRGPFTIGHPAFLLEWADGRGFLIDTGMDREAAEAFGRLAERVFGAGPIQAHGSLVEQLGDRITRISGVAFTHLHADHTNGLLSLCAAGAGPLDLFQTPWQAERGNYSTRGRADLEAADCARPRRLEGGPIYDVPGFPGLVAVAAGGHTPGSTVWVVRIGERIQVLAGDVTNLMQALRENRPKPTAYSLFLVPESPTRLEELRLWLADLDRRPAFSVLVSHDLDALEASAIPAWGRALGRGTP